MMGFSAGGEVVALPGREAGEVEGEDDDRAAGDAPQLARLRVAVVVGRHLLVQLKHRRDVLDGRKAGLIALLDHVVIHARG